MDDDSAQHAIQPTPAMPSWKSANEMFTILETAEAEYTLINEEAKSSRKRPSPSELTPPPAKRMKLPVPALAASTTHIVNKRSPDRHSPDRSAHSIFPALASRLNISPSREKVNLKIETTQ